VNDITPQFEAREALATHRLLAKANPPPILHRYRGANEWAVKEIADREVHLTRPEDMNDPFEFRAPLIVDRTELRAAFAQYCRDMGDTDEEEIRRKSDEIPESEPETIVEDLRCHLQDSGIICCSATPSSNRMWGYYASSHRGICIGYRTDHMPFQFAMKVNYEDPSGPVEIISTWSRDASMFSDHVSCRKGKEWEFEQEYRIPVGSIPEGKTRLLPIKPESIAEVRLGAKIQPDFRDKVLAAIASLPLPPKVIQMGSDFDRFTLTETEVAPDTR